jgi:hypothetical protein
MVSAFICVGACLVKTKRQVELRAWVLKSELFLCLACCCGSEQSGSCFKTSPLRVLYEQCLSKVRANAGQMWPLTTLPTLPLRNGLVTAEATNHQLLIAEVPVQSRGGGFSVVFVTDKKEALVRILHYYCGFMSFSISPLLLDHSSVILRVVNWDVRGRRCSALRDHLHTALQKLYRHTENA